MSLICSVFVLYLIANLGSLATAFAPLQTASRPLTSITSLEMLPQAPPQTIEHCVTIDSMRLTFMIAHSNALEHGVASYIATDTSSQVVALQERKIPTKEEIEAKKRNFNVIFWGRFVVVRTRLPAPTPPLLD